MRELAIILLSSASIAGAIMLAIEPIARAAAKAVLDEREARGRARRLANLKHQER